jgi:hypothetical protein
VDEEGLALVDYPSPSRNDSAVPEERQVLVGAKSSNPFADIGEGSQMTDGYGQVVDGQMEDDKSIAM